MPASTSFVLQWHPQLSDYKRERFQFLQCTSQISRFKNNTSIQKHERKYSSMDRRTQIIEKLSHMTNAELDRFIDLMLRLREMPEEESRRLAEVLGKRKDTVEPLPAHPAAMSETAMHSPVALV